ncbi:MAG: 50S ribosomal protein L5 [Candidatus Aenigmatarchaeota archaeon]
MSEENPMREIELQKVVLNIGTGGPGEELEKAKNLLEDLTGREAKVTEAKSRSAFGVSKGRDIGVMVTLRGEEAEEFLERALKARDHKLKRSSFDDQGNFSVGIQEHIDLPGTDYDPEVGIFGMDITATLERPGFSIKRKKIPKKIGENHKITKQEAIDFMKEKFNIEITGE